MKLTLGFSSCPNDTFMFDALVHNKIDVEGLEFDIVIEDVEQLNLMTLDKRLDITKLSYNAFLSCFQDYIILNSGSAFGLNSGPLFVSAYDRIINQNSKIGIPGKYTTANMLLSIFYPKFQNKTTYIFSEIEDAIISKNIDAGVIIHENRFTYKEKGLKKIADLGKLWKKETSLPIPLGGIAIKRNIPNQIQEKVNRVLHNSINYALNNKMSSFEYVKSHAQEMTEDVIYKHIDLYVNDFSISLNKIGKQAILELFNKHNKDACDIFLI